MIVRYLIDVERFPGGHIFCLKIAGENTVPEFDFLQLCAGRVVTPDHTHIQHVEVIIRKPMHTTVVVVMAVRNNHADDVVLELRRNMILHAFIGNIERTLARSLLRRFIGDLGDVIDVAGQVVPVPERHQQPDETGNNNNISWLQSSLFFSFRTPDRPGLLVQDSSIKRMHTEKQGSNKTHDHRGDKHPESESA